MTAFRKVLSRDRLPNTSGRYICGFIPYGGHMEVVEDVYFNFSSKIFRSKKHNITYDTIINIEWWLEEIQ